jgi:hypothetical protein
MKDAGYKIKTRWFFVNKVTICTGAFILTLLVCFGMHIMQTNFVYTDPTADYNLISNMNSSQEKKAMATTKRQNIILDHFRGKDNLKDTEIYEYMKKQKEYENMQDDDIYREINNTQQLIKNIIGEEPKLFRPPYRAISKAMCNIVKEKGMNIVLWSNLDPRDWSNPGTNYIVNTITSKVQNGTIILLHDHNNLRNKRSQTIQALDIVIPKLKAMGYKFVTVSELIEHLEKEQSIQK